MGGGSGEVLRLAAIYTPSLAVGDVEIEIARSHVSAKAGPSIILTHDAGYIHQGTPKP